MGVWDILRPSVASRVLVSQCGKYCGSVSRLDNVGYMPLSRSGRIHYHPRTYGLCGNESLQVDKAGICIRVP